MLTFANLRLTFVSISTKYYTEDVPDPDEVCAVVSLPGGGGDHLVVLGQGRGATPTGTSQLGGSRHCAGS